MTRHVRGWRRGRLAVTAPILASDVTLPQAVDLTQLLPPVLDQQQLGSCVANSTCEALEFLERGGSSDRLFSRLYLYFWGRAREGIAPTDDSGMQIAEAVATLQERGVCLESSWPYDVSQFSAQPPAACDTEAERFKVIMSFGLPNLFTIKACLSQGFPCVFGMDVYRSLLSTSSGDVEMPDPGEQPEGGHAVLCVGYSDAEQRLTFRNSWGSDWGMAGNGTIPYAFVTEAIATDFVTFRRATL